MFKNIPQSSVAKKKKNKRQQEETIDKTSSERWREWSEPGVRVHRVRVPQSKKVLLFYSPFLPAPLNQLALPATSPTKPLQTNGQEVVFFNDKERENKQKIDVLALLLAPLPQKGKLKSKPKKWSVHAHFCIWLCAPAKGYAYPEKVIALTDYWQIIKTQDNMNATLQKWMIVKSRMNLNKWASGRCSSISNGIIFQRGDYIAINTCINPCIKTALPLMVLKWQLHGDKAITLKP